MTEANPKGTGPLWTCGFCGASVPLDADDELHINGDCCPAPAVAPIEERDGE